MTEMFKYVSQQDAEQILLELHTNLKENLKLITQYEKAIKTYSLREIKKKLREMKKSHKIFMKQEEELAKDFYNTYIKDKK